MTVGIDVSPISTGSSNPLDRASTMSAAGAIGTIAFCLLGPYSYLGGVNPTQNTATDIHEFAENVTTVLGAHTLRYGFAYRINRNNRRNGKPGQKRGKNFRRRAANERKLSSRCNRHNRACWIRTASSRKNGSAKKVSLRKSRRRMSSV